MEAGKDPSGQRKGTKTTKIRYSGEIYVGMDLHKDFMQVAVMDNTGKVLCNTRVENNENDIKEFLKIIPKDARMVMESSSVWYYTYLILRDAGYTVTLSNPYKTKAIAYSKVKTDKVDARILADLLRTGMIPSCYIPPDEIISLRNMTRHRSRLIETRSTLRHRIHSILLMNGIRIPGSPFTQKYVRELRALDDYRIDNYLDIMDTINDKVNNIDNRIALAVQERKEDALLLTTIPGIGYYSALVIISVIGDIGRFPDSHRLCSYVGLVPSVHSSGENTYHGRITKRGSPLLRSALIQCVHSHRRVQPNSTISKTYDRIAAKKSTAKAVVAAASKMLRVVYRILVERREYIPEGPK